MQYSRLPRFSLFLVSFIFLSEGRNYYYGAFIIFFIIIWKPLYPVWGHIDLQIAITASDLVNHLFFSVRVFHRQLICQFIQTSHIGCFYIGFRNVLFISCSVSGLGLIMVLILMILLSKHIVRPFSENYEKQKRFITDAGHEIKTPITIINADTEVLEMDTGPNEWIDDIRVQTERLSHLTKDLIYLARIEEGENQTQMIEFPLSELISETAVSFQAPARKDSKTFTIQIEPLKC